MDELVPFYLDGLTLGGQWGGRLAGPDDPLGVLLGGRGQDSHGLYLYSSSQGQGSRLG